MDRLVEVFESPALDSLMTALDGDYRVLLEWWRTRLTTEMAERAKYAIEVAARRGPRALLDKPQVIVGTIHSVKGGQADVVFLFPDLSLAADVQYRHGGKDRDPVIRQFYVGITRAFERLYVCNRESLGIPL